MNDRGAAHQRPGAICGVSVSCTPLTGYNKGVQFSEVPLLQSVESWLVPMSPMHSESNSLKPSSIKAVKWPSRHSETQSYCKERGSCLSGNENTRRSRSFFISSHKQLQSLRSRNLNHKVRDTGTHAQEGKVHRGHKACWRQKP